MNAKQEQKIISNAIAQGLSARGVQHRLANTRSKKSKSATKRHFRQVERNVLFDSAVETCRKQLAEKNKVRLDKISISAAIRYAVILVSNSCEYCGGTGIVGIRNGDDDIPCKVCNSNGEEI